MVAHSGEDREVGLQGSSLAGEAGDGREVPLRIAGGAIHLRDREGPGHAAQPVSPIPPKLIVMPGLVPGIHVGQARRRGVDGRDKPGHDEKGTRHRVMGASLSGR